MGFSPATVIQPSMLNALLQFPFASGGVTASNVTAYIGRGVCSLTESAVQFPLASALTFTRFFAAVNVAPGTSQSFIYTLRKNGVDQLITCTISGASLSASDTVHSVGFLAGDLMSVKVVTSVTALAAIHDLMLGA